MDLKLFKVMLVVFVAILSVVLVAVLLSGLISTFNPPLLTDTHGIMVVAGGVSERSLRLVYLVVLLAALLYFWRRRSR